MKGLLYRQDYQLCVLVWISFSQIAQVESSWYHWWVVGVGKPPGAKSSAGELGGSPASRSIHEVAAIFVPKPMQHQTRRSLVKIHLGKILVLITLSHLLFHINQEDTVKILSCQSAQVMPSFCSSLSELVGISSRVPSKSANATRRGWTLVESYFCANDSPAGGFVCQGREWFERLEWMIHVHAMSFYWVGRDPKS